MVKLLVVVVEGFFGTLLLLLAARRTADGRVCRRAKKGRNEKDCSVERNVMAMMQERNVSALFVMGETLLVKDYHNHIIGSLSKGERRATMVDSVRRRWRVCATETMSQIIYFEI